MSISFIQAIISLLGGGFGGGFSGGFISYCLENRRFAKLSFHKNLIFNTFSNSVRVLLKVENNKGVFNATNTFCQISVEMSLKGENESSQRRNTHDDIRNYIMKECKFEEEKKPEGYNERAWTPLINPYDRYREVSGEPVSWNIWVSNGTGIENMVFKHVGIIPNRGFNMAILMDIYKTVNKEYILRINSEYGPEDKPKLLLKLPIGNDKIEKITISVVAAGNNVETPARGEVTIKPVCDKDKTIQEKSETSRDKECDYEIGLTINKTGISKKLDTIIRIVMCKEDSRQVKFSEIFNKYNIKTIDCKSE
ncbi:hypothetical protein HS7_14280 [Sulfolobales archaeon HS-7]|nr:hypothetical protein HS7_14280 [Sulfolobales archaeon HS-7]